MGKTIIVSNRLPIKVSVENDQVSTTASEGGLATGLGSIYRQDGNLWIGWPGVEITEENLQQEVSTQLSNKNLKPVFLSQDEINQYYEGFSNEVLWPIFHYYASIYASYKESNWECYKQVNKKFCDAILSVAEPGDTIWVHDYQLLLLAGMLRDALPDSTIGFFLHIPFPSFELFRLIPWRNDLIEGILGADLIGFHTFDDATHFIQSAIRLLHVTCSSNIISMNNRPVLIETFPMGIDDQKYASLTADAAVVEQVSTMREMFTGKKIIVSIDRLDYSKGILQRLEGFNILLEKYPEYREKVILHMIVVPSRDSVPQYQELKDHIDKAVGDINARYRTLDWNPINYFYRPFPIETLSALYCVADICLVTPMRDGMNLVCKEYVASRINEDGVLILSEMAGAAKELIDAILVNPNNVTAITDSILQALNMPLDEQKQRMKAMRNAISKFNINQWVKNFMERLHDIKQKQASMNTRRITDVTEQAIRKIYHKTEKRIIFLDYDGTLVGFKTDVKSASPDDELYALLENLCDDPANTVVLISGRNYNNLEEWFGHLNLSLVAEHGAWQKQNGDWESMQGLTDEWKHGIRSVMETYADRTPGAFIEEKDFSLVWHYRKVEKGLGELRTDEMIGSLRYLLNDNGLQLLMGNKVVEIKNAEINKGRAVLSMLQLEQYDFMMAVGDDNTDEDIFKALPENALTIKVGANISAARFYLKGPEEVRSLLKGLLLPAEVQH